MSKRIRRSLTLSSLVLVVLFSFDIGCVDDVLLRNTKHDARRKKERKKERKEERGERERVSRKKRDEQRERERGEMKRRTCSFPPVVFSIPALARGTLAPCLSTAGSVRLRFLLSRRRAIMTGTEDFWTR